MIDITIIDTNYETDYDCNFNHCNFGHLIYRFYSIVLHFIFIFREFMECPFINKY